MKNIGPALAGSAGPVPPPLPEAATGGLVEHEGITECLTPIIQVVS